jgi:hypothetical protein
VYPNPYQYERSCTGLIEADRCPICGSSGDCPDAAAVPMPLPPVDLDDVDDVDPTPLRPYTVTVYGFRTLMRLNDSDAARYGVAAVLIP